MSLVVTASILSVLTYSTVEAGFFDVLDEIILEAVAWTDKLEVCSKSPHRSDWDAPSDENCIGSLARLFTIMQMIIFRTDDSPKQLLCQQFPRPRTLGALVHNDLKRQGSNPRNSSKLYAQSFPPLVFVQICWQTFAFLQFSCVNDTLCSRRGCKKRETAKCGTCKETLYCGAECQRPWVQPPSILSVVFDTTFGRIRVETGKTTNKCAI